MELDYKAIGKRIKIARIKQNLTQETVADRIGVTPQHISNVETGNTSVSLPTLIAIANTLQVSMDELLCDTLLASAPVYEREAQMLLKDCTERFGPSHMAFLVVPMVGAFFIDIVNALVIKLYLMLPIFAG